MKNLMRLFPRISTSLFIFGIAFTLGTLCGEGAFSFLITSVKKVLPTYTLPEYLNELKSKKLVLKLNSQRLVYYSNQRIKDEINYISYPDISNEIDLSKGDFHKYLLQHLPKGYKGDPSVNINTTRLEVCVVHYTYGDRWELKFTLWSKNDNEIILADNDEIIEKDLPDMSRYGYK